MAEISFDTINDLNLEPNDSFNWEGKATSLYCIVAGNISYDTRTQLITLHHLSKFYQGVFFVTGPLDCKYKDNIEEYNLKLSNALNNVGKIASLFHNVVIIDGIALCGANGWQNVNDRDDVLQVQTCLNNDLFYLHGTIKKLQVHLDVKKIIIITNSVPGKNLYFGEEPQDFDDHLPLQSVLSADTENKVTHWVFGNYQKNVDTIINGIHYTNNPYNKKPYWAKRITLDA